MKKKEHKKNISKTQENLPLVQKLAYPIYGGCLILPITFWKSFHEQYDAPKTLVLYSIGALSGILLLREKQLWIPFWIKNQKVFYLVIGLLLFYFGSIIDHWNAHYTQIVAEWLSFFLIFLNAYRIAKNDPKMLLKLTTLTYASTAIVMTYGFLQTHGIQIPTLTQNGFPSSFFGFQNLTAEFIGISLLFQGFYIQRRKYHLLEYAVLGIFFGVSCYYLHLLACRSVLVGLGITACTALVLKKKYRFLIFFGGIAFCFAFFYIAWESKHFHASGISSNQIEETKKKNISTRIARWTNTLRMIQEHPFGIGPGRYTFEYVSYHNAVLRDEEISESTISKTPHNSYLQAAVSGGIPCLLILIALIFLFIRFLLNQKQTQEMTISILFFTFILVNCFFAFPLDNLYPFFMTAIFLGLALSQKPWKPQYRSSSYLLFPTIALSYFSFIFLASELFYQNKFHYPSNAIACSFFPENWYFCSQKIRLQYQQKQYLDTIASSQELLRYTPNNFVYLFYLFAAYSALGEKEKSCKALKSYDNLFNQSSKLHHYLKTYCPIGDS
jgi:O-antigen ligase